MTDNPYESPETEERPMPPPRSSSLRIVGIVLLTLGMFPAAAIAFFVTCAAVGYGLPRKPGEQDAALTQGFLAGSFAGTVVLGVVTLLIILLLWRTSAQSRSNYE